MRHSSHPLHHWLIGLMMLIVGFCSLVLVAHAQSPDSPPNVIMHFGKQYPSGVIGSSTFAYSAKSGGFVPCGRSKCGRITAKKDAAGRQYHVVRLSRSETKAYASYGYRVKKRDQKYVGGKYYGDSTWDGKGRLYSKITVRVNNGDRTIRLRLSLDFIDVSVNDPRQDSVPTNGPMK
jgi:hypothetical protein